MTHHLRRLLPLSLLGLLFSCHQESITPSNADSTPSTTEVTAPITLALDLEAQQDRLTGEPVASASTIAQGKALDYELREVNGKINPYLSHTQAGAGVEFAVVLVSSDASQPIIYGTTTLFAQRTTRSGEAVTGSRAFLRTPDGGGQLTLTSTPDFSKGKWRMALVHGGKIQNGKLIIDPNNLEGVKQTAYKDTDLGIDLVQGAGKYNLTGVSTAPGSKVSLDIPYFSQWVDLELGTDIIHRPGNGGPIHIQPRPRFLLRPQGMLLRLQLKNEGFSDEIELAGLRVLTNSLAFRGQYEFTDAIVGRGSTEKKDLAEAWVPYSTRGGVYNTADSTGYRFPFPHFADFWLRTPEKIARNQYAKNYFLIWAMPIKEANKSRSGILHILLYDKKRTGERYNLSYAEMWKQDLVIPKALIRKPALTRSFPAGRFRLSSMSQAGEFQRLEGWQTPIYNALDFIEKEDAGAGTYYDSSQAGLSIPADRYMPAKQDWARIIPTKTPDNQIDSYKYYHYSATKADRFGGENGNQAGALSHSYNSNYYHTSPQGADGWRIGRTASTNDLYLDEKDLPQGVTFTPYNGLAADKVGKANNRVELDLPEAMLVPIVRNGGRVGYYRDEQTHFSTYHYSKRPEFFHMSGWGKGQTYLTCYFYAGAVPGTSTRKERLDVYARYFGPAFHAVYPDGSSGWKNTWPWDITFYGLGNRKLIDQGQGEIDDTKRTFTFDGYQVLQADGSYKREAGNVDNSSDWMAVYWSKDNEWFFTYRDNIKDNYAPAGYDKAQNAVGKEFTPGKVKARIRLFSKKPLPR